jgi:hypothetical protein
LVIDCCVYDPQAVTLVFAFSDQLLVSMAGSVVYVWTTMKSNGSCVATLRGHVDVSDNLIQHYMAQSRHVLNYNILVKCIE